MQRDSPPIDTRIEIVTPENIAFQYTVAGPFRRLMAYAIDLLIRVGVAWGGVLLLSFALSAVGLAELGFGAWLVLWFVLAWFYGGLFEAFWNGQTPGKRAMQVRVVGTDGQPIHGFQAVLRNILRALDSFPWWVPVMDSPLYLPLYLLGLLVAATNPRFQRLGDLAAGTMVVYEERELLRDMTRVGDPAAIRLAGVLPADFEVSHNLAQALAGYMQRRNAWGASRRAEIAHHLAAPLCRKFDLPPDTDDDLLLCAMYYRAFIADRPTEAASSPARRAAADTALAGAGAAELSEP